MTEEDRINEAITLAAIDYAAEKNISLTKAAMLVKGVLNGRVNELACSERTQMRLMEAVLDYAEGTP